MYDQNQGLTVNIHFGNACNMKCRYCLQTNEGQNKKADVNEFIERFTHYISSNHLKINKINYQGGETLLYFSQIRKIIEALHSSFPDIYKHRITTNGTLIDEDYVEFCNSYPSVFTALSLHEFDIPAALQKVIGKLKQLHLTGVIHKQMPLASSYYFEQYDACRKMGHTVPFSVFPIHATDGANSDTYLTKQDVDNFFEELLFKILPLSDKDDPFAQGIMQNIVYHCRTHSLKIPEPKCHHSHLLSIDLFGNTYACHHNTASKMILGNIFDAKKIIPINHVEYDKHFKTAECQNCDALNLCLGGCYLSNTHGIECYWYKMLWMFWEQIKDDIR